MSGVHDDLARLMSDEQLMAAVEEIRGNPKRGKRRRLRLAEIVALSALLREQERRTGGAALSGYPGDGPGLSAAEAAAENERVNREAEDGAT